MLIPTSFWPFNYKKKAGRQSIVCHDGENQVWIFSKTLLNKICSSIEIIQNESTNLTYARRPLRFKTFITCLDFITLHNFMKLWTFRELTTRTLA